MQPSANRRIAVFFDMFLFCPDTRVCCSARIVNITYLLTTCAGLDMSQGNTERTNTCIVGDRVAIDVTN